MVTFRDNASILHWLLQGKPPANPANPFAAKEWKRVLEIMAENRLVGPVLTAEGVTSQCTGTNPGDLYSTTVDLVAATSTCAAAAPPWDTL